VNRILNRIEARIIADGIIQVGKEPFLMKSLIVAKCSISLSEGT